MAQPDRTPSAASSYMLFDSKSANALGSYGDVIDARVALRECVDADPSAADDLVLIGYDDAGTPVGDAVTFADLPPSSVTVEDSPWLVQYRSVNGG